MAADLLASRVPYEYTIDPFIRGLASYVELNLESFKVTVIAEELKKGEIILTLIRKRTQNVRIIDNFSTSISQNQKELKMSIVQTSSSRLRTFDRRVVACFKLILGNIQTSVSRIERKTEDTAIKFCLKLLLQRASRNQKVKEVRNTTQLHIFLPRVSDPNRTTKH